MGTTTRRRRNIYLKTGERHERLPCATRRRRLHAAPRGAVPRRPRCREEGVGASVAPWLPPGRGAAPLLHHLLRVAPTRRLRLALMASVHLDGCTAHPRRRDARRAPALGHLAASRTDLPPPLPARAGAGASCARRTHSSSSSSSSSSLHAHHRRQRCRSSRASRRSTCQRTRARWRA